MINNAQSLKDKAKNFANKNNLKVQVVLQNFMFERFLDRLSKSKYKNNFIIKGGFLLSSIMGIEMRSTMDIDANITGMDFTEEQIKKLIENVSLVDLNDNVSFSVDKENVIREDNEYGGYSFKITGKIFNIVIPFHIDISTGDIITPKAIEYKYKTILEDEYIDLYTYNYETIIAEKLQTILTRGISNSRMKDYYDLYYFVTYKWNDVDRNILKDAISTTFIHRNTKSDLEDFKNIISAIEKSEVMKKDGKVIKKNLFMQKKLNL